MISIAEVGADLRSVVMDGVDLPIMWSMINLKDKHKTS
jgi:hypothetical protein